MEKQILNSGSKEQLEIKNEVKNVISRISRIHVFELEDHIKIRDEVGMDSLMVLEILATCEKDFSIRIDEAELSKIETIGDYVNFVLELYLKKNA